MMAPVSSIPSFSSLPISLTLRLDPHPARPESSAIPPILLDLRVEILVTILILRQCGDKVVEPRSNGIRGSLVPSSRVGFISDMKLEIVRAINLKLQRTFGFCALLTQRLFAHPRLRKSHYIISSGWNHTTRAQV